MVKMFGIHSEDPEENPDPRCSSTVSMTLLVSHHARDAGSIVHALLPSLRRNTACSLFNLKKEETRQHGAAFKSPNGSSDIKFWFSLSSYFEIHFSHGSSCLWKLQVSVISVPVPSFPLFSCRCHGGTGAVLAWLWDPSAPTGPHLDHGFAAAVWHHHVDMIWVLLGFRPNQPGPSLVQNSTGCLSLMGWCLQTL